MDKLQFLLLIAIMNAAAVMLLKFISYIKSVFISKYCHGKEMV